MALMAWLPIMVQALLSGGDPTTIAQAPRPPAGGGGDHAAAGGADADAGAAAVLLSGIPFACAAAASTFVGAAMQRTGRPLHYLSGLNLAGGAAFVAFHRAVRASRAAGFACLVATLSCAYAGAPAAPWIVARLTAGPGGGAAVALPLFNSLAMLGGFLGPAALGALAEKLRGDFGAATALLGCSMLVAGALAGALGWAMARDPETRQIVAAKVGGGAGGRYEAVASKEADPEAASP
ncbi:hypothetical protein MNEG_3932 [Monoraphidium neglectum]|uniref:Major facilitator superfamily (MFS) profile domain-containing protein n=1 Tax=Monoraphidium neglectum TaxID=145388 RepID=A0A0D2JZX4_9CHLO|nr:hypothetical protein MNEG_3932 [Monoraphidium neglectum]KIZ04033.1 hypothetical protein MNEG_3932 [Monoraphidium neglectum]|eukprot:XP_013903052.1 hypothetical protein MNEG_3932 [Monoraphidium neglectum]